MVVHKKREMRNCWGIEEGIVSGDCKDDFVNKVEERIFDGDCGVDCIHKSGFENEEVPIVL